VQTIEERFETSTEVKRSKFLAYLVPIVDYKGLQDRLKSEHPKANHVIYALRTLNEYDQIIENSTDDNEPKGCAGVPTLNVLRGENLINCAVLIVRYFGGIKLGTGGMARAYALATKNVIKTARLITYEKMCDFRFDTSYSDVEKTLYLLRQIGIVHYEREFGMESVTWDVHASEAQLERLKSMQIR